MTQDEMNAELEFVNGRFGSMFTPSRNPFSGRIDNRPFYAQAYEQMPAYGGPEALDPQFQLPGGGVWERNMLRKQDLEAGRARDKMNSASSSNWASVRSGMAMRGGIDQGARERMAAGAAKTNIMGNQEQSRLDQMARLGLGAEAENKNIDARKFNIQNSINQGLGRNAYNASKYDSLMKGYAAEKSAQDTEKPGKKS